MGKKQKFEFNEATQVLTLIGNPKFRIEEDALEIEFKW